MWGCNENVSGGAGMTNAISVKDRLKKQNGGYNYIKLVIGLFLLQIILEASTTKCWENVNLTYLQKHSYLVQQV